MSKPESKQRLKARVEKAFAAYTAETIDQYLELYHPDVTMHFLPPGLPQGREGSRVRDLALLVGFPDARVIFEDWVIEGDKVAARFEFTGTHRGEFLGIPPTNRRVSVPGLTILRFAGDQVIERWSEMNYLGLLQALGVSPFA